MQIHIVDKLDGLDSGGVSENLLRTDTRETG